MYGLFRGLGRVFIFAVLAMLCYDKFINTQSYHHEGHKSIEGMEDQLIKAIGVIQAIIGLFILLGSEIGSKMFFVYTLLFISHEVYAITKDPNPIVSHLGAFTKMVIFLGVSLSLLDRSYVRKKPKPL